MTAEQQAYEQEIIEQVATLLLVADEMLRDVIPPQAEALDPDKPVKEFKPEEPLVAANMHLGLTLHCLGHRLTGDFRTPKRHIGRRLTVMADCDDAAFRMGYGMQGETSQGLPGDDDPTMGRV